MIRLAISLPAAAIIGAVFALGIGMVEAKQPACSRDDIARAASAATSARAGLLNVPVDPAFNALVPPEAQQAITAMKDRLGDLVAAYMRCAGPAPSARAVERDLAALVPTGATDHGTARAPDPLGMPRYGDRLAFEARVPAAGRRLLSIVARFQIPCGEDAVLLVLEWEGGIWKEALRWQSKDYAEISGAFMAFDYAVLPPGKSGGWFVATRYVTPWCTSNWREIRYAILQPAADRGAPTEVLSGSDGIYMNGEDLGRITADQDSFTLQFHGASIDPEIHNRVWIRRFRRAAGASFVRVPPVARGPVDFVDEWIVSPWGTAEAWSPPRDAPTLKPVHDRLGDRHHAGLLAILSLHRCRGGGIRHQVAVQVDGRETLYFFVSGTKTFVLRSVTATPDSACAGSNLLHGSKPAAAP